MRAVNLLPRENERRQGGRRVDPLVAGGAALSVVVLAALGGGFALEHSHAASERQKLAAARSELARLQAESRQGSGARTPTLPTPVVTQQQLPWEAALTSALATRVAWDDVLAQLARVVPSNVTVSTVSLGSGSGTGATASTTAPPPGSAGSLTLGGSAFSESGVAQLIARLGLVPDLSAIALTSSTADPKSGVVTFTITAQVGIPTPPTAIAAPASGGAAS